jgi:tetratricopeptide (TPR) repeat protein
MTGLVRVIAPGDASEEQHELFLREGRVVHVRPPHLDEPLGHILHAMGLLDRDTYARSLLRMAEERARHGTILRKMGVVNDEQIAGAVAIQILRRAKRMFELRDGRYAIEPIEHDHGRLEDGEIAARGIGVRRVIYHGVVAGYNEADLVHELNALAGKRVRLRREEARRLGRYGFGVEARGTLELLSKDYCAVAQLIDSDPLKKAGSTDLLKVIYTLLVTEMLEVEHATSWIAGGPVPAPGTRPVAEPTQVAQPPQMPPPRTTPAGLPNHPFGVPPAMRRRMRAQAGPVAEPRRVIAAAPSPKPETLDQLRKGRRPPTVEIDPRVTEARARFLRGDSFLQKGDIYLAIANLRAAMALAPDDPDIRALLALATWRDTELPESVRAQKARQLLIETIGKCPSCAQAYRVYATIYAEQGHIDQAIRAYGRVLQLVPADPVAMREIKRLERKRQRVGILDLFRK